MSRLALALALALALPRLRSSLSFVLSLSGLDDSMVGTTTVLVCFVPAA